MNVRVIMEVVNTIVLTVWEVTTVLVIKDTCLIPMIITVQVSNYFA